MRPFALPTLAVLALLAFVIACSDAGGLLVAVPRDAPCEALDGGDAGPCDGAGGGAS